MGALAAHRQAAAMADATVASEIHQPFDRLLHFAPQVALDLVLLVDDVADAGLLLGSQIVAVARGVDLAFGENLLRRAAADSIDIGQRDFHPLVMRQFDSSDTCHTTALLFSWPVLLARLACLTAQPWRCLWRGLEHRMRTTPSRRTTLQFLQIFFTDALTFIAPVHSCPCSILRSLPGRLSASGTLSARGSDHMATVPP